MGGGGIRVRACVSVRLSCVLLRDGGGCGLPGEREVLVPPWWEAQAWSSSRPFFAELFPAAEDRTTSRDHVRECIE